jgi:hypothetical protein
MQRTANFHDQIANACLPQAAGIVDDAAALDTAVDMLDAYAATRDAPIRGFLRACELPPSRLAGRHDDLDLLESKGQEAQILEQPAPCRQRVGGGIGNPLIMGTARAGLAQKEDREHGVDQEHIFDRVVLFLAAITAPLLSRILGALDAPFGPVVPKRGEASAGLGAAAGGMAAGDGSSVGTTRAVASASVTPRRRASSCKDRLGTSPRARRVACSTTSRT